MSAAPIVPARALDRSVRRLGATIIAVLCAQAPAAPRQTSDQLREIGRGSAGSRLPAGRRAASDLTTIGSRRRAEPFAKRAMKGAGLRETQIACDVGHAPPTARELLLGEATQQLVADRTIAVSFPTQAMTQCRCRHAQVPRHVVDVGPVRRWQRTQRWRTLAASPASCAYRTSRLAGAPRRKTLRAASSRRTGSFRKDWSKASRLHGWPNWTGAPKNRRYSAQWSGSTQRKSMSLSGSRRRASQQITPC